jgi:hypothetical protein
MQSSENKPNLKKRLFWEYDFDHIDWQQEVSGIIARVIERGTHDEWDELVKYYKKANVIGSLKNDIVFLPDEIIEDVCQYFKLKPNDLLWYTKKQSQKRHWI